MSCAIANAVMDVVENEKLQENARIVGEYLLSEGIKLGYEFDMIGNFFRAYVYGVPKILVEALFFICDYMKIIFHS